MISNKLSLLIFMFFKGICKQQYQEDEQEEEKEEGKLREMKPILQYPLKESPEKSAPSSDGDGPRDEVDAAHEANEI